MATTLSSASKQPTPKARKTRKAARGAHLTFRLPPKTATRFARLLKTSGRGHGYCVRVALTRFLAAWDAATETERMEMLMPQRDERTQ